MNSIEKKSLVMFFCLAALLTACVSKESARDKVLFSVIRENVQAAQAKNKAGFMATIHEDSPIRENTEKALDYVFSTYNLKYEIKEIQTMEYNDSQAKVKFTQITTKVDGPAFQNNKISGFHILKKDAAGKWKIFDTQIEKMEKI